jgi:hypothetical protein
MKNNSFFLAVLVAVVFLGCSKNRFDTNQPVIKEPTKISDLVVPATFPWSTAKTVTVNVTGLPTLDPVYSTLIIGLTNGTQLYKDFHDMSQNLTVKISIPAIETALKIKFGSVSYDVPINVNTADFSFIPIIQDINN